METQTQTQSELIESWKEQVKESKEFEVFLAIKHINQAMEINTEMSDEMILENRTLMRTTESKLKEFGVTQETEYQKWYQHWDTWGDTINKEFEEKYIKKESIDEFLPRKIWNE